MEKRFLLAFLLSFLILSTWSALFPSAKRTLKAPTNQTQTIDNKRDITQSPVFSGPALLPFAVVDKSFAETIQEINNETLTAKFSNQGGSIKAIYINKYQAHLPLAGIFESTNKQVPNFDLVDQEATSISYESTAGNIEYVKKYYLPKNEYLIKAEAQVKNKSAQSFRLDNVGVFSLDVSRLDNLPGHERDKSLFEYSIGFKSKIFRRGNAFKFSEKDAKEENVPLQWVGFRDRYNCIVIKPSFETLGYSIVPQGEHLLQVFLKSNEEIAPGEAKHYSFNIYYGPQKLDVLKKYNMGFEQIMAFSNWEIFDTVAKWIYQLLFFLYRFIPNWGLCIILISFILYSTTYPLTLFSMKSMRRMQEIQPQIAKMKEQYKNNPQKLNKELVDLYKEHKINPLSGCFPLFLQMPIFIGIYQVLWRSVSFKGAHFLWIKDLSEPDRLFILPAAVPIIGNEFNILPILMMILMFFQQKLSTRNTVVVDEAQLMQQKMMVVILPLMMGFFFYKFASGLSLYFVMFYLMSTLVQWRMSKLKLR